MARRIPKNRFDELVRAATAEFIARGYRLTQMSDVAEAVGVAKGTLYGYVESKDALLWACLRYADEAGPIPLPEPLPIPTLPQGQIGLQVKAALGAELAQPLLFAALERERADDLRNSRSHCYSRRSSESVRMIRSKRWPESSASSTT